MNAFSKITLALVLVAAAPALHAAPAKSARAPKPEAPRSVFVIPTSPKEGRDPFFPESTRPYEDSKPAHTLDLNAFAVKGISFENGRAMVIINNHTFAIGDEGDVLTPAGRAHLRLISIGRDAVEIEVNGSRRQINIVTQP